MAFCYPELSRWDCLYFRLGGPGLGNLLFPWARAKLLSMRFGYRFIQPTWPQLKFGPFFRGEPDSRTYFSMFRSAPSDVQGCEKFRLMMLRNRIPEQLHESAGANDVVVVRGMGNLFHDIASEFNYLSSELHSILLSRRVDGISRSLGANAGIAIHVRFGDFMVADPDDSRQGGANRRQPIDWYINAVNAVRSILGYDVRVNVFSDGSEHDLARLLQCPSVFLVRGNSAIEDILLMGQHRLLIASGSTFSMWASFLGQVPTIWYPGQRKFRLVCDASAEVELEDNGSLPSEFVQYVASRCTLATATATSA